MGTFRGISIFWNLLLSAKFLRGAARIDISSHDVGVGVLKNREPEPKADNDGRKHERLVFHVDEHGKICQCHVRNIAGTKRELAPKRDTPSYGEHAVVGHRVVAARIDGVETDCSLRD